MVVSGAFLDLAPARLRPLRRHRQLRPPGRRARHVLRGLPAARPDLPAGRGRGAVVGADPGRLGAAGRRRGVARLACRVDGHQPDAHRADGPGGRPLHPGAGRDGGDHPGLRTGPARQDRRTDPDDAAQPDLPGARARSRPASSTPADGSPPRRSPRSSTTSSIIVAALLLVAPFGVEGPRHRRRRSARSATCSSSSGRWRGSASATRRGSTVATHRRARRSC